MHAKIVVVLLVFTTLLVNSEPPPEIFGGGGGWYRHPSTKIKPSGPSKIFGWLGSRFAKIPHFFPKILPEFPKYHVPHKLPSYQAAIVLPQHPSTGPEYHHVDNNYGQPEKVEITQTADEGHYEAPPQAQPQQEYFPEPSHPAPSAPAYDAIPEFNKGNYGNDIDVVQSQLISYNKEIIPPSQWQDGYADQERSPAAPFPVSSPPLYNNIPNPPAKTVIKHVPVVPHSTGPDYFDTAYGHNNRGSQAYQQSYNQDGFYQAQSFSQEPAQPPVYQQKQQPYQQQQQQQQQQPYQQQQQRQQQQYQGSNYETVPSQQFTVQNYRQPSPTPAYKNAQQSYSSPAAPPKAQAPHSNSAGFVNSGIPGVQILSQSDDGGNPVFEVLADHDAPSFNGHPFDINKLIAMIEPGAQLAGAPELSHAASESQNVYQPAPGSSASAPTSAHRREGVHSSREETISTQPQQPDDQ